MKHLYRVTIREPNATLCDMSFNAETPEDAVQQAVDAFLPGWRIVRRFYPDLLPDSWSSEVLEPIEFNGVKAYGFARRADVLAHKLFIH